MVSLKTAGLIEERNELVRENRRNIFYMLAATMAAGLFFYAAFFHPNTEIWWRALNAAFGAASVGYIIEIIWSDYKLRIRVAQIYEELKNEHGTE